MNDIDLNTIQMLSEAARRNRPQLNERQAREALVELMARFLHYQDSGEPDWMTTPYEALAKEYTELPRPIIDRCRNDAKFNAQVNRAVAGVLDIIDRSPLRQDLRTS